MWLLDLSFVNVGQTFYGFGWETMLLEAGFLAIFLGAARTPPSGIVILLYRWMLFRTMFGGGPHQDPRRRVLEGPDLPLLPLRDAADAEPAVVVLPLAAEGDS